MRTHRILTIGPVLLAFLAFAALAGAQTWSALNHPSSVPLGTSLLLTDGTVMSQQMATTGYATGAWWRLTPDNTGSYLNGTWTQLASMPSGYAPLYYASAVLPDGRVVVEGGEYNVNSEAETNLGAIYNPATNAWTSISPPSGWSEIGDGQSVVLANGTFMLGNCCYGSQALLNESTLTWTPTGANKNDPNSEEGWTLLPSGEVLTVDTESGTNSELYDPTSGSWSLAGSTISQLPYACPPYVAEVGPAVLRPEGSVFATGGTSNTAIFTPSTGSWSAGPTFPSGYGIDDGPGAVLPDGNVLVDASPIPVSPCPTYHNGSKFYEFNGTSLTSVSGPPRAGSDASYVARMLVLPTGQVLFTDGSTSAEIYTAAGTYQSAWQPTITSVASTLTAGTANNVIEGTQFNGLSQGAAYGDDAQMATNYPLVRITNNASGHVVYCKTHNHSTMGVATGTATVSTEFDIPSSIGPGASQLVVVANGIPSKPVSVTIAGALSCTPTLSCYAPTEYYLEASITLSCNQVSQIAVTAEACINTMGCGSSSNSADASSVSTSANDGGLVFSEGGSCPFTWTYGGHNYSETLPAQF
jgi:hypothetical protein